MVRFLIQLTKQGADSFEAFTQRHVGQTTTIVTATVVVSEATTQAVIDSGLLTSDALALGAAAKLLDAFHSSSQRSNCTVD